MNKTVLLLEDSGFMFDTLKETLEENNFIVLDAYQVSDAKGKFTPGIDFLIVDLNVPPVGLTKEELDQTVGGLLSGWIWLKNYVFEKNQNFRQNTIIYAAYTNLLKEIYPNDIKGIKLMDKEKYGPSDVINEIKKLLL
jgi:hypothetical protein